MQEIWKDIVGYEGYYQISNIGRVKSLDRYVKGKFDNKSFRKGRILKSDIDCHGYEYVMLCKNSIKKRKKIHRLVAIHYIDNPNKYNVVNHIDANSRNNSIKNLEWCTQKHNMNHAFDMGIMTKPKKVIITDKKTMVRKTFRSQYKASKYIGKSVNYIFVMKRDGKTENEDYKWENI